LLNDLEPVLLGDSLGLSPGGAALHQDRITQLHVVDSPSSQHAHTSIMVTEPVGDHWLILADIYAQW
jgi:hypothetical protein